MSARTLLAVSLLLLASRAKADSRAVMLFLSARDQPDTLGYNIVSGLPALLHDEILSGSVPLWDSPEKQVRIQPSSLKSIEQNNNVSFVLSPQLFILEIWNFENNLLTTEISGFYFTDRNESGKEISYGFVDYRDAELALTAESIRANANGSCFSTYKYILLNHLYFYNIVQFGKKKISNLDESQKIKDRYASTLSIPAHPLQSTKKIVYRIESDPAQDNDTSGSRKLLLLVENYLKQNREVYLNLGGARMTGFPENKPMHVKAIDAEEIWTRHDSGFDSQLLTFIIRTDSGALDPLAAEELWKLDIRSGERTLPELLKQKEFYFRILAINTDLIAPEESEKYRKALQHYAWNRIREYVRYE